MLYVVANAVSLTRTAVWKSRRLDSSTARLPKSDTVLRLSLTRRDRSLSQALQVAIPPDYTVDLLNE